MKKTISYILALTLLFSTLSMGIPQLSGGAWAATLSALNHTFETDDPNFGSIPDNATLSMWNNQNVVEVGTGATGTIQNTDGNRYMQIATPENSLGSAYFYFQNWETTLTTGNCLTFESDITFSDLARAYDVSVTPADWSNYTFVKFLTNGDISVLSNGGYVKRGTYLANTKYTLKLAMYKDIDKYDLFITQAGNTTMLASGESYNNGILDSGIVAIKIAGNGTAPSTSGTVLYDNIKLTATDDVRDTYTPATDETVIRTTTFETDDTDPTIAAAQIGDKFANQAAVDAYPDDDLTRVIPNVLDSASKAVMSIIESNGSRCVEVATTRDEPGDLGFPVDSGWGSAYKYKSYTLEVDLTFKDQNADYYLTMVDGGWGVNGVARNMLIFSKGNIYARSVNIGNGQMAARTTYTVDQPFTIRMVVHTDTKSYDLYRIMNGITTKLVNSEPIVNTELFATNAVAAFFLTVPTGTHERSVVLADNIKISGSNIEGTAPMINPNPGRLFGGEGEIGIPVNYYVSPTGSDNNDGKSPEAPFQSLQKAADRTNPGDTVYLMDGTWSYSGGNRMLIINRSGAFDKVKNEPAYITYKAYEGAHPKLFCDNAWDVILVQASYIIIDGIEIEGNNQNLTLEDGWAPYNYWRDQTDAGRPVNYSNGMFTKTNTNGISISSNNLELGLDPFHHVTVRNCVVHDMPAGGIGSGGYDYVTFENNTVYNNCWFNMYACSGMGFISERDIDTNTTTPKMIIRNNIVHDNYGQIYWNAVRRYSDGNGIILDVNKDTNYHGKTLVENNIVWGNGGSGIHAFRANYIDVVNNTLYDNNKAPGLQYSQMFAGDSEYVNFFNNIVYSRDLRPGETNYKMTNANGSEYVIYANNIYYNGGTPDSGTNKFGAAANLGINDVIADPKFVSLNPASPDFLRLSQDSPAIDKGTQTLAPSIDFAGNSRPQGAKYDIGAYETTYTSATPIENDVIDIATIRAGMTFIPEKSSAAKGTPTIDGTVDSIWSKSPVINVNKYLANATDPVTSGATSKTRVLWDEDNLYVLSEVTDPVLSKANSQTYQQDSVELFLDENNEKTTSHQPDDRQYRVNYDNEKSVGAQGAVDEFVSETSLTETGYIVEVKIPLKTIKGAVGEVIGFDAQVNDDKGTGKRDATAVWSDIKGSGYSNTSRWGDITLVDSVDLPTITTVSAIGITTTVGVAPILPSTVTAEYSNQTTSSAIVLWDTVNPDSYAQVGTFIVTGTVSGSAIEAVANVTVNDISVDFPTITAINAVNITTTVGTTPTLPSEVTAVYGNTTPAAVSVLWDAVDPNSYAQAGTFTVNGTVIGTEIKAVANVTVNAAAVQYALSIGAEQDGGAGKTRAITITGENAANLAGKYLIVQFTEGSGVSAKVSVVMIAATSQTTTISYANTGTKVDVWLASGMPDLVGENLLVTLYANTSTAN